MKSERYIICGILNWGLGHATRSVAVINALLKEGYTPVIASDGVALDYLRKEFPELDSEELPSYNIRYNKGSFLLGMMTKLPEIAKAIRKEQRQLNQLVQKYSACGVISDNRLGFHSNKVPSVYITHQLRMMLPFPLAFPANYIHHSFIRKYSECWIPDLPGRELSGRLSESTDIHRKRYIGPLSRFKNPEYGIPVKYDILVILSGPEPQRSILEEKIILQLGRMKGVFMLIRGVEGELAGKHNFEWKGLAGGAELCELIRSAKIVVSRSGYSSLMDYYYLANQALLIPTPGQEEQEYLSRHHLENGTFYSVSQRDLDLVQDIEMALKYKGFSKKEYEEPDWKELFGLFQGK